MSTANPHYPGKSLPRAIPLPPPVRRAPPIIRPIKPAQAGAQALPAMLPEIRTSANKITGRLCGCCGKEISRKAARCPYCQSWSKSAVIARRKMEWGMALLIFSLIAIFWSCLYAWPKQKYTYADESRLQDRWLSGPQAPCFPWHEKIYDYRLKLSPKKFLTSVSGWIVISSCIVFVCSISMIIRRKRKINRIYC